MLSDVLAQLAAAGLNLNSLFHAIIANSVTQIGNPPFAGATGLLSITFPDGLISIGNGAFEGCTSLGEIIFPASLTTIGDNAFNGTTNLTTVSFVSEVPPTFGSNAFAGTSNVTFTVPNEEVAAALLASLVESGVESINEIVILSFKAGEGGKIIEEDNRFIARATQQYFKFRHWKDQHGNVFSTQNPLPKPLPAGVTLLEAVFGIPVSGERGKYDTFI
jgi:hypothetical protein